MVRVCIAFGLCLALVFAFRRCTEFGIDADSMVDVILIGVVLGIASARLYYVAMAPYDYDTIWDVLAVRDGGLAIYGGIIGAFVFGGLACKWRGVPVLPMFDLTGMGFLIGQGCGRWGNFFNQEAFGCNTTLPWGMFSEATEDYLMGSTVTVPKGVTIDPPCPSTPPSSTRASGASWVWPCWRRTSKSGSSTATLPCATLSGTAQAASGSKLSAPTACCWCRRSACRASQPGGGCAVVGGVALEIFPDPGNISPSLSW